MRTKLSNRLEQAMIRLEGRDPGRDRATLLVVDDERGPRESLRMILSPQHRVLIAEDSTKALALLEEQPVDAITVDLNMPGMKGDALVRRVRKDYPHVEVIVITGYSSVETAVDGLRHGIFDYLSKPFDVVQVSNTVRRALARRDNRTRIVDFLRGIAEVLGQDRDADKAVDELTAQPELRQQLREAIERSGRREPGEPALGDHGRDDDVLRCLAAAAESREPQRSGHAQRVAFLAGLLSERLALPTERREEIRAAALLHDLGRLAAPQLDDDDTHAEAGATLVRPLGLAPRVAEAILHHHARFDGQGADASPRGEEIPLASRVIAVADAFDKLVHDEPGREALSPEDAILELRSRSGRELDPDVLKELILLAEVGASSSGPLLGACFVPGRDPADTIASATAWLEIDR